MATNEQRTKLLAVPCPWCGAGVGELCSVRQATSTDSEGGQRRRRPKLLTTLDGGCHDLRWQAAQLGPAPVLTSVVLDEHTPRREPQPVGAGSDDRPW